MDIGAILSNKYVWIGGAALGALLLLSGTGAKGESTGDGTYVAMWSESMRNSAALNQTALDRASMLQGKQIDANVTMAVRAMDTMTNLAQVSALQQVQTSTVRAGVFNNIVATNAAMTIDRQQNMARISMTYEQARTTRYVADRTVDMARINAKATKEKAMFDMIGTTVGSAVKAAAMFA